MKQNSKIQRQKKKKRKGIKPQSAKAKGRNFQKDIVALLIKYQGINEEDLLSTSMGAGGEDVFMSADAREKFPFSIECKHQKNFSIWSAYKQAELNSGVNEPIVFVRKNNKHALTVLCANWFRKNINYLDLMYFNFKSGNSIYPFHKEAKIDSENSEPVLIAKRKGYKNLVILDAEYFIKNYKNFNQKKHNKVAPTELSKVSPRIATFNKPSDSSELEIQSSLNFDLGFIDNNIHRYNVRTYYEDTDFTGIVYHTNYLKFAERGRTNYLRLIGINHSDLINSKDPKYFVVYSMETKFLGKSRIDDILEVRSIFKGIKGPRLKIDQDIFKDEERLFSAKIEFAVLDNKGKPRRFSEEMIAKIKKYLS